MDVDCCDPSAGEIMYASLFDGATTGLASGRNVLALFAVCFDGPVSSCTFPYLGYYVSSRRATHTL